MDRYWDRKLLPILEMPDAKIEIAKKILQTLSVAAGPLNFEAFCESIAVSADGVSLNSRNHMFSDPNDLLELCPGLIEFSAVDADGPEPEQCPNLVHPSVREYLFSGRIETTTSFVTEFGMNEDQANSDMAQTCLTYLLQFKGDESRIGNVVENYNFLSYAATFWNIHVKKIKCPLSPSLERLIIDFFTSEQSTLQTWLHAYDPDVEKQRLIRPTPFPSALYYASLLGYSGAVEALLEGGAKTNESCGKHNYPLLAAVEGGHVDVARMLIEHRADLEARYINKDPALVRAAQRGRIEIIAMLIEEGANVNAQDRQGKTPLRSAIIYVRQNSEDYEQILRLLLQAGATIDIKDQQVWTPLHWAVRCDREPMVQLLLDARADIEARDKNNQTPLHHAALFQEVEMRCLLAKGANIEVADRHGRTPLFEAAAQGFAIGVRLLLEHGADIHSKTSRKETALHLAVRKYHVPVVRALLKQNINIEAKDYQGRTALHIVVEGGDHCDPTYEERTSEELAVNNLKIVSLLLESGANMYTQDAEGKTPVELAQARVDKTMAEMFQLHKIKQAPN